MAWSRASVNERDMGASAFTPEGGLQEPFLGGSSAMNYSN